MENFWEVVSPAFLQLLSAVVMAIVAVAIVGIGALQKKAEAYLVAKLGNEQMLALKEFASTIVRALSQSPAWQGLAGDEKKELAIIAVANWAKEHNLPITHEYLDSLIEEAVQKLKAGL